MYVYIYIHKYLKIHLLFLFSAIFQNTFWLFHQTNRKFKLYNYMKLKSIA